MFLNLFFIEILKNPRNVTSFEYAFIKKFHSKKTVFSKI